MLSSKDREENIKSELNAAYHTKTISLSHLTLSNFPPCFLLPSFQESTANNIIRLDLSHNFLQTLPSFSYFLSLRELWLRKNPLIELPDIEGCERLEVIDIRDTKIASLPLYVCKLAYIHEIDWFGTPMMEKYQVTTSTSSQLSNKSSKSTPRNGDTQVAQGVDRYAERYIDRHTNERNNGLKTLINLLEIQFKREQLELELVQTIEDHYLKKGSVVEDSDALRDTFNLSNVKLKKDQLNKAVLEVLVQRLRDDIPNYYDFRLFVRRITSFLPETMVEMVDPQGNYVRYVIQQLIKFQRNTERARLAADVEICLRNFYFDQIERRDVEVALKSIYDHVELLEDVEFLIKYSSQVLPPDVKSAVDGEMIWNNITQLQFDLTNKRENAVNSMKSALANLYPEQTNEELFEKTRQVAKLFQPERFATKRELNTLAMIAADAEKIFPPDFASIDYDEVFARVKELLKR